MQAASTETTGLSAFQRFYVIAVVAFILGPFVPLIIQSFAFRWAWPDLLPSSWWLERRADSTVPLAWDYVLSPYSQVGSALFNTLFIGFAATLLCLVICLPAARVLAREQFRGKAAFEFLLSMPLIVPEAVIGMALLMIYIRIGLAGSYLGIIVAHLIPTIPYMVRMLTSVYQGLANDYEEQATILGADRLQILVRVTLPMLMPGVVAGALFTFLVSSNVFLLTFFLGQGRIVTLPTLLFSKISGGSLDATAAGIALVASLPGILLFVVSERLVREELFVSGLGR